MQNDNDPSISYQQSLSTGNCPITTDAKDLETLEMEKYPDSDMYT